MTLTRIVYLAAFVATASAFTPLPLSRSAVGSPLRAASPTAFLGPFKGDAEEAKANAKNAGRLANSKSNAQKQTARAKKLATDKAAAAKKASAAKLAAKRAAEKAAAAKKTAALKNKKIKKSAASLSQKRKQQSGSKGGGGLFGKLYGQVDLFE